MCVHCQGQGQMLCEAAGIWRVIVSLIPRMISKKKHPCKSVALVVWDLSLCVCVPGNTGAMLSADTSMCMKAITV